MATIFVTGSTGAVMNPLCARLLEKGHTIVALVRPSKGISPAERLAKTLDVSEEARRNLFVLPGDITQELGGVAPEELGCWHGKIEKLLHGAASIKFMETPDNQVFNTNVRGTENMLRLAEVLEIPEFHYVSTAYVCGNKDEFSEGESAQKGQPHRNAYERSKVEAEKLVHESTRTYSIYRIPIVVGDFQTGEIGSFSGYYGFLTLFWQVFQSLRKRWEENPEGLRKQGVTMDEGGYLHVPLAVPCSKEGPLNLVTRDWLTTMFFHLVELPASGGTYHLTHPNPRGVRETMIASLAHLGLQGIECGEHPQGEKPGLLGRIQKGILKGIEPYWPYISKDREHFRNEATVRALGEHWENPPAIDSSVVRRLLDFAKYENFGRS